MAKQEEIQHGDRHATSALASATKPRSARSSTWPTASRRPRSSAATSRWTSPRARAPTRSGTRNAASSRWATPRPRANCSISTRPSSSCRRAARQHDQGPHRRRQDAQPPRRCSTRAMHTIAGTKEKTFDDQDESDSILEDLEVTLGALREELHIFAKNRGTMVGNITIVDKRRRDRLPPHGLRRLRDSQHRRAGRDPVQEMRGRSSSCTSKKTRSGAASTKTASGKSTTAS